MLNPLNAGVFAAMSDEEVEVPLPDVSNLVTEDDTPVDGLFSERQKRLLADSLYTSWDGPGDRRPFLAMANVALYAVAQLPPLVPDVLVSVDVRLPDDPFPKGNRSYFLWLYGKPPDVVIEIVSNRYGGELGDKLLEYDRQRIAYYVVYDPERHLSAQPLHLFARQGMHLTETTDTWLGDLSLGLALWEGEYEGMRSIWLRWVDRDGTVLAVGSEAAALAKAQAEQERRRAEQERQRAEQLAAKLRALGADPEL